MCFNCPWSIPVVHWIACSPCSRLEKQLARFQQRGKADERLVFKSHGRAEGFVEHPVRDDDTSVGLLPGEAAEQPAPARPEAFELAEDDDLEPKEGVPRIADQRFGNTVISVSCR